MYKFSVYLYVLLPLLSIAEDNIPLELSILSSKSSSYNNELVFEQRQSHFQLGNDLKLAATIDVFNQTHGDLLFNHYQQQLNFAIFDQQSGLNSHTPVELHHLHLGSSYALFDNKDFYLKTGFGLTYFSAPQRNIDEDIKLSMSLGVYRDYYLSEHASIQFATRVYGTLMGDSAFTANTVNCQVMCDQNNLWLQKEVSLTFQFRF